MFFRSHGLLWQNARNLLYIKGEDFLAARKIADSKLKTKKFLAEHQVAVPETLWILSKHSENTIERITSLEAPFVIKPNNGYGGKGIVVVDEVNAQGNFVTNTGDILTPQKLKEHISYVLDGFFSLSGGRDKAIIEKKIVLTKEIDLIGSFGLPDIRVIAYNMVPVMAMIRIPTQESGGKANIHGGACAAGIDIGTGKITYISHRGKIVKSVPWIGDVRGIVIPYWDEVLSLVVKVQQATKIKFLGCDIVLDAHAGPLLLEINIRPWLEIQNVNLAPLRSRLDKIEGVEINSIEKWVRLGRDLFSWDIEERIRKLSGKEVLGNREYIKIFYNEKHYNYLSYIRISLNESKISEQFVQDVLKIDTENKTQMRLECEILWKKRTVRFQITRMEENIVLGKNALRGFLIDPFKYKKWETPILPEINTLKNINTAIKKTQEEQILSIDERLFKIDKKLLILKYITPTNLREQKQIFIEKKWEYVPQFTYEEIPFDISDLMKRLEQIEIPDIPYAELFIRKKKEIEHKLKFFLAFQNQDTTEITKQSEHIFGSIDAENFQTAKQYIAEREQIVPEEDFFEYPQVVAYLKKFNHIYKTKIRCRETETTARFTMKGDTLMMRKDAKVWKREMRSIIAHEIEGHYLRKINGKKTGLQIMSRWWARYIETDEGIAIYNQNRFLSQKDKKYYSIFERYYFVQYALKHSYKKLIAHLSEFYHDDYDRVFTYMLRLKRGFKDAGKSGVFMKDVVYVNGLISVQSYLQAWGKLEDIYLWKLHLEDIQKIKEAPFFTQHKKDILIPFSA